MIFKIGKKLLTGGGGRLLGKHSRGAILIEFAFAVPIMIMLLYYIHDLVLLKQIQRRMHFNTLCAVSMMQNVSQNRTDKKITKEDLDRIFKASYMAVFSNPEQTIKSIYKENSETFLSPTVILFEGTGNNRCKIKWYCWVDIKDNFSVLNKYVGKTSGVLTDNASCSLKYKNAGNVGEEKDASVFYQDLKIQKGEIKVVVETCIYRNAGKSIKELIGFYIFDPKIYPGNKNKYSPYFVSYVIFSPRPGIFDPTTPPQ